MDMVFKHGRMEQDMRVNGEIIKQMIKGNSFMLMGIFMMGNG